MPRTLSHTPGGGGLRPLRAALVPVLVLALLCVFRPLAAEPGGKGGLEIQRHRHAGAHLHRPYYLPGIRPGAAVVSSHPGLSAERCRFAGAHGGVYALTLAELETLLALQPALVPVSVERCTPCLDLSLEATGADRIHPGALDGPGLDGAGVVIGLVDTGIDVQHPDFLDEQGRSRILAYWDQVEGVVYNTADLQAGSVPNRDDDGHGTHVAGIAAGSGRAEPAGQFTGYAPAANLVVVRTTFLESDVLAGVQWVYQQAAQRDLPAVVNLSLESHIGPHDGSSWFERELDALTGPGRLLVVAAGNNAETGIHTREDYGQSRTLAFAPEAQAVCQLAAYVISPDRPSPVLIAPDGTRFSPGGTRVHLGTTILFPAVSNRGSDWECLLELQTPSNPGVWQLEFTHPSAGSRSLQAWGRELEFANPVREYTLGMPSTADSALCVGSFVSRWQWDSRAGSRQYAGVSRLGQPSLFSAWGPRVDGQQRPHLLMPGQGIFAPLSSAASSPAEREHPQGNYWLLQGTSMAAPSLAGGLALVLGARPELGPGAAQDLLAELGDPFEAQAGRGLLWLPDLVEAALGGFSGLVLEPGLDELVLTWQLNTEPAGGSQRLYRVEADGDTLLATLPVTTGGWSYTDRGLDPGETVRYRLELLDDTGTLLATLLSRPVGLLVPGPELLAGPPRPNPTADRLELPLLRAEDTELQWRLFSLEGRQVLRGQGTAPRGEGAIVLDLAGLASGPYLLEVSGAGRREHHRVTVLH